MNHDSTGFRPGWIHFTIFGISMLLIGINRPDVFSQGFSHIALQCGIVGCVASLGFGHLSALQHHVNFDDRVRANRDSVHAILAEVAAFNDGRNSGNAVMLDPVESRALLPSLPDGTTVRTWQSDHRPPVRSV